MAPTADVVVPKIDDTEMPAERHVNAAIAAEDPADRRTSYEAAIAWVKAFRRDRGDGDAKPTSFISYAWGDPQHERWVEELADYLENADVAVIFDRWHNRPGTSISRFIESIEASNFVCPVGTPRYRLKDQAQDTDPVAQAELRLIKSKLRMRDDIRRRHSRRSCRIRCSSISARKAISSRSCSTWF
jgi:hypothetical protein